MSCTAQRGSPYGMESYTAGYPIPLGPVAMGCSGVGIPYNCADVSEAIDRHPQRDRCIARCKAPPAALGAATFRLQHAALRCNLACWRSGLLQLVATLQQQLRRLHAVSFRSVFLPDVVRTVRNGSLHLRMGGGCRVADLGCGSGRCPATSCAGTGFSPPRLPRTGLT